MIELKGQGIVSVRAVPMNGGGQRLECDMVIDFGKDKPIQLISKNKDVRLTMLEINNKDKVYFEGHLKSECPGVYYILIDKIKKVSKST